MSSTVANGRVGAMLLRVLGASFSPMTSRAIVRSAMTQAGRDSEDLERLGVDGALLGHLLRGVRFYAPDPTHAARCRAALEDLLQAAAEPPPDVMVPIVREVDIVRARQEARTIAAAIGFDHTGQVKIATAVSELARNIFRYASTGKIELSTVERPSVGIRIVAVDHGPGIANIDAVLSGSYRSKTGMGLGLLGCQRLMDAFEVDTAVGRGTRVVASKHLAR
jgi:serine/threonine-protein kinase RsbT